MQSIYYETRQLQSNRNRQPGQISPMRLPQLRNPLSGKVMQKANLNSSHIVNTS